MAEFLNVKIENLRGIKKLELQLNLSPGIYAITGQNSSGKSTLMASLASIFYRNLTYKYFNHAKNDNSRIYVSNDDKSLTIHPNKNYYKWKFVFDPDDNKNRLRINGFYEGSIIYGNRFRDTNPRALFEATKIQKSELVKSEEFVWKNLGIILHNNKNHYRDKLFRLLSKKAYNRFKFNGSPYFYELEENKIISQFSLSTGENLLISVLHSIQYQLRRSTLYRDIYLVLLDEIELALHPSALNRLIHFLDNLAKERRLAIYFSTHSVELIRQIPAENIYFLKRHLDNVVEVQNPVSPAYATRAIYIHDGYDLLVLVEDKLAKSIVHWIMQKEKLNSKKLIHVLPAGGWENVISLHQDVVSSYIVKSHQKAISVLDGDIKDIFKEKYINNGQHGNLNIFFLPIKSAEKYLRKKIVEEVDFEFYNDFGDTFFRRKSLDDLLTEYKEVNGVENDLSGKKLLSILKNELIEIGQSEKEFYTFLTEYMF